MNIAQCHSASLSLWFSSGYFYKTLPPSYYASECSPNVLGTKNSKVFLFWFLSSQNVPNWLYFSITFLERCTEGEGEK